MCVYLYTVYIYISGQKWSTAHRVLKSYRSKIGLIYMCNHKNNAPFRLSPQWLWTTHALRYMVYIMSPSLWVATKPLWWYPGGHIVFMIEYINIYIYIYTKNTKNDQHTQYSASQIHGTRWIPSLFYILLEAVQSNSRLYLWTD